MKAEKKILLAFILNLGFSVFEFLGGIFTGSVAIVSDAVHDMGDAISIGFSYFLERKSKRPPDERYTYGYLRYSVLGSLITTLILLLGSGTVICNAVGRLLCPRPIHYNGMILFALVGVAVNFCAALFTREGDSLNQKAVNLHMLEDVLGWLAVLVGAVVMRLTDWVLIDPLMSIAVAVFILVHAAGNLKEILDLLLVKTPKGIPVKQIKERVLGLEGVLGVHHIHLWSMDGVNNYATMHIVTAGDAHQVKDRVRHALRAHGIGHATLELETPEEHCHEKTCQVAHSHPHGHHHH